MEEILQNLWEVAGREVSWNIIVASFFSVLFFVHFVGLSIISLVVYKSDKYYSDTFIPWLVGALASLLVFLMPTGQLIHMLYNPTAFQISEMIDIIIP